MSGAENPFLENDMVAQYPIEILIDQNLRKDGIVKPLDQWPGAHILRLHEIVITEIRNREEIEIR